MKAYLNGEFVPRSEARIPIDDRGFLFADGVYEVVRVYGGRPFLMAEHLERLAAGLDALQIRFAGIDTLAEIARTLLQENGHDDGDATIYMQVTRGAAPRRHAFPDGSTEPTVLVTTQPFQQHPDAYFEEGVEAVTVPDTRWSRCDIKSVSLLPNVLANQAAKDAGAFEALFVRDGVVLEGSHSNLVAVFGGTLVTAPRTNYILAGITRALTLELARELGLPFREAPILAHQLAGADELFLTGTTTEIMPVVRVDGRPIGDGRPGPVTQRMIQAFRAGVNARAAAH